MAQTKVKLISDGVIDVNHLASGHSITTDNIGEGSNLYYTDARVSTYLSTNSYATEGYVTTAVANLVDSAPTTLDTLNELAAALGDDPNFATTVTNSIATKLPLAGGTLTGNLTMNGSNLIAFGNGTQYIKSPDGSDLTLGAADDINFNSSYMRYFNSSNVEYARLHGASGASWINGGGNLGINTNTPTQRLHVSGTIYTNGGNFKIDSGYELTWGNGNTSILGNTATGYLDFRTSNGTKMYIDSSGNVGVSTNSPNAKLHVGSTGTNAYSSTITKGSNMKGIMTTLSNNTDDMVGIYFATGSTTEGTHWSGITGSRSNNASHWGTQLNFYTHNNDVNALNDATQKMVIKGDGNVGIGTTSPNQKLEVNGAVRISGSPAIELTGSGTGTYNKTVIYNDLTYGFLVEATKHSDSNGAAKKPITLTWRGGYSNNGGLNLTGDTKLYTNDTGLGIDVTSPAAKLETDNGGYILKGGYALFGSYTSDGLFSTNARPNFLSTNGYNGTYSKYSGGNSGLLLGYQDNGAGLYSPAYGFEVKSTDGRPVGGQVVKAIVMRDVDTGVEPFWINNNGSAFFNDSISIGKTSALGGSFHVYGNTGIFQSPTTGSSVIDSNTYSLLLGPKENRNPTANTYYGGIAFNHLLNYNGGTSYNAHSHAWIGLRLYDTPASERSNLVFATKEGTGTTSSDVPIERMTIDPFGMVGIGTSTPSQISSGVPTLTINSPNSNTLSGGVIYQANGSSKAYHYWENNFLVHQVQGTGAHKFAQGASTKFAVYSEGVDIVPGLEYSQQYTYSSSWASSFQQVVPNGTLDSTRVYLFTIWTNSFGVAPYYAAASAILTTVQSTNDNSAGPAIDLLTAHHVGSGSKWQIKMSSGGSSTNGVQVMLAGGPSVSSIPVFVRVTMLSNF